MRICNQRWLPAMIVTCVAWLCCPHSGRADDAARFAKWEKAIAAFEDADRANPPPKNGVVFVGSSSIRLWDVKNSFPDLPVINRGFGGSQIEDSAHFAERIVVPYAPRVIVFYAGDNDIASGKTPERVEADFQQFVKNVRAKLPEATILFLAIKPSPSRWKFYETQQQANARIRKVCESGPQLKYLDVVKPMLNDDGQPRDELFLKDRLHMNADGYRLWTEIVVPELQAALSKN